MKNQDFIPEKYSKLANCLSEGMKVKNYREMCKILKQKEFGGNQKKAQIKEWEKYIDFTRDGRSFVIHQVYKEPKSGLDGRQLKEGIYTLYVERLLMEFLLKQKDCTAILSKIDWCFQLGMINNSYRDYMPYSDFTPNGNTLKIPQTERSRFQPLINAISGKYGLPIEAQDAAYFYEKAQARLYGMLNKALISMERRFLIQTSKVFMVQYADKSTMLVEGNNNKMMKKILLLERQTLENMGFNDFGQVVARHKVHEFYRKFKDLIARECADPKHPEKSWTNIFEVTKVLFLPDKIKKQIRLNSQELAKLTSEECKHELNSRVANSLDNTFERAKSKFDKEIEEQEENACWGTDPTIVYTEPGTYVEAKQCTKSFQHKVLRKSDFLAIQRSLIGYLIRDN